MVTPRIPLESTYTVDSSSYGAPPSPYVSKGHTLLLSASLSLTAACSQGCPEDEEAVEVPPTCPL